MIYIYFLNGYPCVAFSVDIPLSRREKERENEQITLRTPGVAPHLR